MRLFQVFVSQKEVQRRRFEKLDDSIFSKIYLKINVILVEGILIELELKSL